MIMENLIDILKAETSTLKTLYIEKTLEWCANEFSRISDLELEYCSSSPKTMGHERYYETQKFLYRTGFSIINGGLSNFLDKQKVAAERHYEDSIAKLALRIEKKGLSQDTLKVKTSHIGMNIETTLTDGSKFVRAFTILAVGEVNRPHYRYLVK